MDILKLIEQIIGRLRDLSKDLVSIRNGMGSVAEDIEFLDRQIGVAVDSMRNIAIDAEKAAAQN